MIGKKSLSKTSLNPEDLHPGLSIDCVIMGFDLQELHILILRYKNSDIWALPGGFIRNDEDLDSAAIRVLQERTGLQLPFLHQFHTFGDVDRKGISPKPEHSINTEVDLSALTAWLEQRFISTGYLSLVDMKKSTPTPDFLSDQCQWMPLRSIPPLMLDHQLIVKKALEHIRNQINYLPIGVNLLPEQFTMKELQYLYESIILKPLDRSNFQKKMLKLGILDRGEKLLEGGAHKAPYLYSFNPERYKELLEKGIGFIS